MSAHEQTHGASTSEPLTADEWALEHATDMRVPAARAAYERYLCEWRDAILLRTVRAVNLNAAGWHADDAGKARALDVIAVWTAEALAGRLHPAVEAITNAD